MNRPTHCVYCLLRVDVADNFLRCDDCNMNCHIGCLKRPGTPGDIVGDCFFAFRCSHCTDDGREHFSRQHLPWAMMVVMALHQLSVQSRGLSHHGYFHWRTHIACFIEKNWVYLMGSTSQKKKKKWIGTISGTLSHNTPVMFQSGFATFQEQGWWKLTHPTWTPKKYMEFYQTQRTEQMKAERLAAQAAAGGGAGSGAALAASVVPAGPRTASAAAHLAQQTQQVTATESEVSVDEDVDIMQVPAAKRNRGQVAAAVAEAAAVEPVPPKKKKYSCSRLIPYMNREPYKKKLPEQNTIEADLAAFLSSNISAVDFHLNLENITDGLANTSTSTDNNSPPQALATQALAMPSTSAAAAAAATSSGQLAGHQPMPSTSGGSSRRPATTSENWPEDFDFLRSVDLMTHMESTETEAEAAAADALTATQLTGRVADYVNDAQYDDDGDDDDDEQDDDDDQTPIMLLPPSAELTPETMFQPRIVQVTDYQAGDHDYQEILNDPTMDLDNSFEDNGEVVVSGGGDLDAYRVKEERMSDDDEENGGDAAMQPVQPDAVFHFTAGGGSARTSSSHRQIEHQPAAAAAAVAEESAAYAVRYQRQPSLFTRNPNWNSKPWLVDEPADEAAPCDDAEDATDQAAGRAAGDSEQPSRLRQMTPYEEAALLRRLRNVMRECDQHELASIPSWVRRCYRKLILREWRRSLGETPFDLDEWFANRRRAAEAGAPAAGLPIARPRRLKPARPAQWLDRYYRPMLLYAQGQRVVGSAWRSEAGDQQAGQARLAGTGAETEPFCSPQTGRMLVPLIFRMTEAIPQWVRLMSEVQYVTNNEMPFRSTIDFYYVRPCHIAAVNVLLQQTFWPGIEMSEVLRYPDYSVVAMYKKLVVGCAFMVPDIAHNTAYISFMAVRPHWQKAGIATFMLYHLAQTCPQCDISLHVSVSNPAAILYQKFGFKIEEYVRGFYEQYLPSNSRHDRTAMLMRRKRDFVQPSAAE